MRIAHFTNTYKPNINGVSRSVSAFRDTLTSLGHQVFVFAPGTGGYKDHDPFIFRYPVVFDVREFNYSISLPVSPYIDWVLPRLKPQVIHSNHPLWLGDVAAGKAEALGVPLVFTFHTRYTEYSHYVPFNQAFVRGIITDGLARYLRRCQHIVTPSDSIRKILAEHGVSERVTTIPTGIDLAPYQDTPAQQAASAKIRSDLGWEEKRVLVSVGRLGTEKNWTMLLEACALVMADHTDVRLLLVGDGPQREELEKHCHELGIARGVRFTGRVPFEQVPHYLKAGEMFCYTSLTETQGLVTMEALAAGLPVVAVDATGTRDAVEHGVEGLLTENDPQALAEAIRRLLGEPGLRERLTENAARKVAELDIEHQAQRLLAVYEQAIEDKRAGLCIQIEELTYT